MQAYAERALPAGLVVPSSSFPNIRNEAAFTRILADVVGPRPPRRARLVVPDRSVRMHVLNTDAVVPQGPDLRQFLVWRLRDTLAFEPRDARVAYMPAPNGLPNRLMAITLVAREQVIAQYERAVGTMGARVAHVAPAACHLFNLAGLDAGESQAGIHGFLVLSIESVTFILSSAGIPHYTRTFPRPAVTDVEPSPTPRSPGEGHTTSPPATDISALIQEVARTIHHAVEEAGLGPPARIFLAGEMGRDGALASSLQEGLETLCTILLPTPVIRGASTLPVEAQAVLAAALVRI